MWFERYTRLQSTDEKLMHLERDQLVFPNSERLEYINRLRERSGLTSFDPDNPHARNSALGNSRYFRNPDGVPFIGEERKPHTLESMKLYEGHSNWLEPRGISEFRRNPLFRKNLERQNKYSKADNSGSIIEGLQALLADTYILYIKTQNFHWNVKGPHFGSLHKMFDDQYLELAAANDLIAERITALDGYAAGSCKEFTDLTRLEEVAGAEFKAELMIKWLLEDHEKISEECRSFLEKLDDYDDEVTAQLVADRALAHDKTAWMLRSHLQ